MHPSITDNEGDRTMSTPPTIPRRRLLAAYTLAAAAVVATAALSPVPALAGWSFGKSEQVQGSGNVKRETRQVGHFKGLALGLPGQVEVRTGNSEGLTIETDDNLLPLIETVVEGGTLEIRNKNRVNVKPRSLKIVVQTRGLESLSLGGSGSIDADRVAGSRIRFDIGGSGKVSVGKLEGESIGVNLGGSGDLKVNEGSARSEYRRLRQRRPGARTPRRGQRNDRRLGRRHAVGAQPPEHDGRGFRRHQLLRRSAGEQDHARLRRPAPTGTGAALIA
jgi:hypothetical protein